MNRSDLLNLIEAALASGNPTYARQAAQRYLTDWPGDLAMQFALARASAAEGDAAFAARMLEALTTADPENYSAQRLLGGQLAALNNMPAAANAYGCAHIGDGLGTLRGLALPDWAAPVRAAYLAERIGDWETARRESEPALEAETPCPLPSLVHLCALWHAGQLGLALPLAEGFHVRWPGVVAFKLCLAECLLAEGDPARAVTLLHDAAAQDLTGQVAARHWGDAHPYRSLWDDGAGTSVTLPGPLPAALITALGLNRLRAAAPSPSSHAEAAIGVSQSPQPDGAGAAPVESSSRPSEEVAEIQAQLNRLAGQLRSKQSVHSPLRSNVHYLILSSRTRLLQVFGMDGFTAIDTALKALAASAVARTRMRASVVYADDPASLKPFGLRPVNPSNAWDIKTLLAELAARLKAKNHALGALLIVGGPEIIPFHHLPNPTDDADPDIPSDNPYATADENYFVPEWPVGRIPSGVGNNPAPLLRALKVAAGSYAGSKTSSAPRNWLMRLLGWLSGQWSGSLLASVSKRSFGYSANVWKEASAAVYTTIGDPRQLLTCPPMDANALPVEGLAPSRLSYFNLHGIEDGPEWYGQRSAEDLGSVPEYPVALRPADVTNSDRAPVIVFSEACYGANLLGKSTEDALCLRFLDSGSRAVVASTKVAYGSVATPLIGADLLGWCFWQNVNTGLPVGEALRRAKLQMAQEMHARQGFLDGEDQKTLISFVLYGDPLVISPGARPPKNGKRPVPKLIAPKTICDRAEDHVEVSPETVAHIKSVVAQYLPGMRDADFRVAYAHAQCTATNHLCPTAHLAKTARANSAPPQPRGTVVTLSKTLQAKSHAHPHYARLTLDEKGTLIKLAISR